MKRFPGGRTRILVVLDKQPPLIESASMLWERRAPRTDIRTANIPSGVEIDPAYRAIPLGSGNVATTTLDTIHPAVSEIFCIRGYIDAMEAAEIPDRIDGARIFSDPVIE